MDLEPCQLLVEPETPWIRGRTSVCTFGLRTKMVASLLPTSRALWGAWEALWGGGGGGGFRTSGFPRYSCACAIFEPDSCGAMSCSRLRR